MIRQARSSRVQHRLMASTVCILLCTMPAHAQDAPDPASQVDSGKPVENAAVSEPANEAPGTDDIIVTARRVRESQQRVPIAITTFSQEALDRNQIRSLTDLQQFVPSAAVSGYNSRNQEWFTLRGQGQTGLETGGGVGGGPAVVGYLAEVPVNIAGPGLYYDLASLQVLKGPQGTLFGRNTTGGAILFEPNKPTDKFDAGASVTLGSFARHEAQGFLNIPLADGLAVRFAGQLGHRKGYTTDALTGDRYQTRNYEAARIGVQFDRGAFSNYLLG
ncbi:MAG TPA: TonB-dependent receptor plug domain-containing protein, partial [Nitrospira sp.]|nr:TonB-dependent receptor plug domain-containing protein [Nitrospira sp.]